MLPHQPRDLCTPLQDSVRSTALCGPPACDSFCSCITSALYPGAALHCYTSGLTLEVTLNLFHIDGLLSQIGFKFPEERGRVRGLTSVPSSVVLRADKWDCVFTPWPCHHLLASPTVTLLHSLPESSSDAEPLSRLLAPTLTSSAGEHLLPSLLTEATCHPPSEPALPSLPALAWLEVDSCAFAY